MPEQEDDDEPDSNRRTRATTCSSSSGGGGSAPPFSDQVLENVLESVLQFLSSRRDRNSASLVSRSWHRAESQTRLELFVGNIYSIHPSRATARFPSLVSLSLKGRPRFADFNLVPVGWGAGFSGWIRSISSAQCAASLQQISLKRVTVSDSDLSLVARSLPCFRDLTLICCDGFGTRGLASLAEHCKRLRVLDLIDNELELEDDEEEETTIDWISKFPQTTNTELESLSFECVAHPVNFDSLESLVARSPALRRLRLNQYVSAGQLRRLLSRAPHLTHLGTGAFRSFVEEEEGAEIGELCSVFGSMQSVVCLSGFRDLAAEYLPAIYPVCGNLTSLNLSYADISAEQLKPVIRHCNNLLTFWVMDTVRDEGLHAVAAACKKLHELRVFPGDPTEDSEGSVSDAGLLAISEGCRQLSSILYFCQRMTNSAVVTMSINCPHLTVFRLCIMGRHRPDHITHKPMDEGFGAIVKNCKRLRRLAVSGLLTDQAFEYIGMHGKTLRTLSVAFAGDGDLGLRYVLEGCPNLQKLEIRDSPFGDAGLLSGIHHFYNMRFVWMSSCRLTVRGCTELARRLPRLVVEMIGEPPAGGGSSNAVSGGRGGEEGEPFVEKMYMYRSLAGPREDAPPFVKIL